MTEKSYHCEYEDVYHRGTVVRVETKYEQLTYEEARCRYLLGGEVYFTGQNTTKPRLIPAGVQGAWLSTPNNILAFYIKLES
jgi:hypothetical protein